MSSSIKEILSKRVGSKRVNDFVYNEEDYIDLLKIDIERRSPVTIIATNGMSDYKMNIPEKYSHRAFNELYFCLPNYWKIDEKDNPNMNWPFKVIQKLAKNIIENETWYGLGHTIANGKPPHAISKTMKQECFLIAEPIAMEEYLLPIETADKTIRFLSVIPIFQNEFDKKNYLGYNKWIKKFRAKNGNEILNDFRSSIHKKYWFFGK